MGAMKSTWHEKTEQQLISYLIYDLDEYSQNYNDHDNLARMDHDIREQLKRKNGNGSKAKPS